MMSETDVGRMAAKVSTSILLPFAAVQQMEAEGHVAQERLTYTYTHGSVYEAKVGH